MVITLKLYSTLREKLPPEARGQATLDLHDGATLDDLLAHLDLPKRVVISVNDEHEPDLTRRLNSGDLVRIFSAVGGG
ncbi:MAG: MoaD/ThiS family protein [Anaerolineae bacterium]|nr:MAG: MoaD/ThiS family protein [Anaerolineae bacterium]